MNAIVYIRVSSDEQVKGMSLEFQRDDCLRYAREQNLTVTKVYEERGESAKFANRPQLISLLELCRKNRWKIDALIVWKLDRLSRNQMDYYFIKRTLLDGGITIHSATEPSLGDQSSIANKVFETFSALQAEIDNTIRRERSIRGMQAKIESGIFPWHPPLGYHSAYNKRQGMKKTEPDPPDPKRFPLVKKLFHTCLNEYLCGNVALAERAETWGLTSRMGKKLYPQIIDRMMSNKFYAGIVTNPWTGEEFRGRHRAMITPDEFRRVQLVRKGRIGKSQRSKRMRNPDFPLRNTALCGTCRGPLTGSWSRGNGGRYAYYHCRARHCVLYGKTIPKIALEGAFEEKLEVITPKENCIRTFEQAVRDLNKEDGTTARSSFQTNRRRLAELETRLENLICMKERELLTDEEFLARKVPLTSAIEDAKAQPTQAPRKQRDIESCLARVTHFLQILPTWWRKQDVDLKQRFHMFVFPRGVPYVRDEGFGTAEMCPIFEIFRAAGGSKSRLVHLVSANWNQLAQELRAFEELSAELQRLPKPKVSLDDRPIR